MQKLLRICFHLLYHQLAWGYDLVAWCVSLGAWQAWGRSVLCFLPKGRILELGFGPGHLQFTLDELGYFPFGVDESQQMNELSRHRFLKHEKISHLTRGWAQALPFVSESFDSVVTTFPAPFIFDSPTVSEIERTLKPGGRLVALLAFRPSGTGPIAQGIRILFRITGQLPDYDINLLSFEKIYLQVGMNVQMGWYGAQLGEMLVIVADKPPRKSAVS